MKKYIETIINRYDQTIDKKPDLRYLFFALLYSIVCLSEMVLIHLSTTHAIRMFFSLPFPSLFLEFILISTFNSFLWILFRKWRRSLLVGLILLAIWSVANYYTIQYHGGPLFISEFANIQTAFAVMGNTHISFTLVSTCLIIGWILVTIFFLLARYIVLKEESGTKLWKRVSTAICLLCVSFSLLFSSIAIKPRNATTWSWKDAARNYGMATLMVEDVDKMVNYLKRPEGYSLESLEDTKLLKNEQSNQQYPDVILILNESFYDIQDYMEINTDVDPIKDYYNIPGAYYGHAIVPNISGGTNNTEYELLTSNSMYLLYNSAPFNYIDLKKSNSIARYFSSLGYSTAGMHSDLKTNYQRYRAYPELGFDHTYLDLDAFQESFYGNRQHLDSSNYQDMIEYYNQMGEGSRFVYMLTFQNHWNWEKNEDAFDTVHVQGDYGEYTDDLNEYLTSIQMSSSAFKQLIDYYQNQEREVIVCMMGDHCPSILNFLDNGEINSDVKSLTMRSTPFVIWSNIDLDIQSNLEQIPTPAIVPTLLKMGGLPMSTYQKELYDMTQNVGAITSDGKLVSSTKEITYLESEENWKYVKNYFYMEYNDLYKKNERIDNLFEAAFKKE